MKKSVFLLCSAAALSLFFCSCSGDNRPLPELLKLGTNAAEAGKWKDAGKYASQALKLAPADPDALTLASLSLEQNGDLNGAIDQISKAAARKDASYFIVYTKGRLLYRRGDYETCIASLDAAHRMRPEATDPLVLLAQASGKLKNDQQAVAYYSKLLRDRHYQKDPAPWMNLGISMYFSNRNPRKAFPYFNYAYRVGYKDPATVLNMAVFYDLCKDRKNAAHFYRSYLKATEGKAAFAGKRAEVETRLKALR